LGRKANNGKYHLRGGFFEQNKSIFILWNMLRFYIVKMESQYELIEIVVCIEFFTPGLLYYNLTIQATTNWSDYMSNSSSSRCLMHNQIKTTNLKGILFTRWCCALDM